MNGVGLRFLAVVIGVLASGPALASGFAHPVSALQSALLGVTATITVNARTGGGTASGNVATSQTTPAISCNSGSTLNCSGTVTFTGSTTVTLTATPGPTAISPTWVGCTSVAGNVCTATITGNRSITATFPPPTFGLTVRPVATGGATGTVSVAVVPPINCSTPTASCVAQVPTNTTVAVTAVPGPGSTFTGWAGACTGTGACDVLASAAKTVTANFAPAAASVSVSFFGGTGTVTSTGGIAPHINCTTPGTGVCSTAVALNGTVTLSATPDALSNFTGWGGCTSVAGAVCTVANVVGSNAVTAGFEAKNCSSCHGSPPPVPHTQISDCGGCHTGYTATSVNPTLHMNGTVDAPALTCNSCHGDGTRTGADPYITAMPPLGSKGETLTTDHAVGAHVAHLTAGPLAPAMACTDCHSPPVATSHANGVVEFSWSVLAKGTGIPSYDTTSFTCSNTYCHGNFTNGNPANAPVWTAGAAAVACGSCHGLPPAGTHPQNADCGSCHAGYSISAVNVSLHVNGIPDVVGLSCTSCHGGVNPAPPADTLGRTATTLVSVGAHQSHVAPTLRAAIACTECHGAASGSYLTNHQDGTVQLAFGSIANQGTATQWTSANATCASNYCHGGTTALAGGTATVPVWTQVGGTPSFKSCTSCHGSPPSAPHVQRNDCGACHAGYTSTTVVAATHVNGVVNISGLTCSSCHGGVANAAPPTDLAGGSATSSVSVGAHQAHVASTLRPAIACSECHGAAAAGYTATHTDGTLQVAFGALANQGTATQWTRGNATCASNYCHGGSAALGGGTGTTPVWTTVNGTFKGCTSCHGAPPPAPHVQNAECGSCHAGSTVVSVNAATHVNGVANVVTMTCTSCHGDPLRTGTDPNIAAMPPRGTRGETLTSQAAVGAHQAHLAAGALAPAFACTDCHNPPTTTNHANGVVEFSWSVLAKGAGSPSYDSTAKTCSNTYCHGNFTNGATTNAPVWTAGAAAVACGSCHGLPPGGTHPQSTACATCHPGYTSTTVNVSLHVNGVLDRNSLTCNSCHGSAANSAPPVDTHAGSATTLVSVGAHQAHVASTLRPAIACTECHGASSAGYTTDHTDSVVQTSFGALANQGTATVWTRANATCASNYCHGGTTAVAGGTGTTPVWTQVNGTFKACTSCHGAPPALSAATHHPANTACGSCHAGFTATTVNAAVHVNGAVNVSRTGCTVCHGDLAQTGVAASNPALSMPGYNATSADTTGATAATAAAVGAHAAHVTGTRWRQTSVGCAECHVVPADGDKAHATGAGTNGARGTVTFGTLARTGGITTAGYAGSTTGANGNAAGTCSNTYCHGNFANGAGANALTWTAGTAAAACGSCHGLPPGGTHPASNACGSCHTGYSSTFVNVALHLNGGVDVNNLACNSCHGSATNSAPPVDTHGVSLTTSVSVGAHQAHVASTLRTPISCTECHGASSAGYTTTHANNVVDMGFGALANQGTTTTWTAGTATCASTYCHGGTTALKGGTGTAPVWTQVNGTFKGCASCHGAPPPAPHVQRADCGTCHTGFTQTTANAAVHVNGSVDVVALTCTSCHGAPPAAPHVQRNDCGACHVGYTNSTINAATHYNGTVDVTAMSCTSCHGGVNAAPPVDTQGGSVTTLVSVGAHQAHVASTLRPAIACTECHGAASAGYTTTHSNSTVEVAFGSLANQGTATAWSKGTATCASTYCHGGTTAVAGGTGTTPVWTQVNGTFKACTSCHGAPPALSAATHHPANAACGSCHAGFTATTVNAAVHVNGAVNVSRAGCTVCHGDLAQTGVPASNPALSMPGYNATSADTTGATAATAAAVGAHAAHVTGTRWRQTSVGCVECHVVPADGDKAHATGAGTNGARGTVTFGTLAKTGGITTAGYAGSTTGANGNAAGTCSNTYCHGNFNNGNAANALTWTAGTAAAACGSCHGLPPGGTHPASNACASCHTGYTATTVNVALHLNGGVDVNNLACNSCHGGATNSAPPVDTHGVSATTSVSVGAHQAHVASTLRTPIACTECHGASSASYTTTHANNLVDMGFGALANQGTATVWTAGPATCASNYCHGGTTALKGGTGTLPVWTQVNGAFKGCASCHGAPPPTPHVQRTDCGSCHTGFTQTTANAAVHVNGTVDVAALSCSSCHGDSARLPNPTAFVDGVTAAPPVDVSGNTLASARGVGAHLVHVNGTRSKNLLCSDCHDITSSFQGVGHANGVVDMAWGTLAKIGGATPTYTLGSAGSCNATYCHGNFAGSGVAGNSPAWTTAGQLGCTSCHGAPPALSAQSHHPANAACASCHGTGYSPTTVVQATHVDGTVNVSRTGCTACHGDLTATAVAASSSLAAPGVNANAADTTGATATTSAAVGAHAKHLAGTRWRSTPIACGECHAIPAAGDVAHATGTGSGGARATIAFGALARTGSITTAAYAGSTTAVGANGAGTCSNVYCHGNFKNGATTAAPSWLGGVAAADCGSCHGVPPGGNHTSSTNCVNCHAGYTSTSVNMALHLNGAIDVTNMTCTSCHGDAARASVVGADVNQASAPPLDTAGAAAGVRVGTHGSHVNPAVAGAVYKPVLCTECHTDNAGNISHSNNTVNVTFAAATGANLGAFTATLVLGNGTTQTTCATYCHGSSLNATTTRGSVASWSWNSAIAADCGSCHKSPPTTANHHNAAALTTCAGCHGGTVSGTGVVNVAGGLHVNGAVDTSTLTCTTCHGATLVATGNQDPNVGAAPRGTGAPDTYGHATTAFAGVGVHSAHVLGTRSRPVLCNACHGVVSTPIHKTGTATAGAVVLANLSVTGGIATATYAGAGSTCSNTYCHGNLGGGIGAANVTPAWAQATPTALVCASCHGMPPSATSTGRTHPNRSDCGSCHAGYTGVAVNAATHVNGVIEYTTQTCTSCHGDPARTGSDANLVAFSSAPPVDASNASTGAKVGAHAKHLLAGAAGGPSFSKQVACSECHNAAIPATPLHANGAANVAFGTLAKTGTVTPAYAPGAPGTCSNTYCHGNFTNGNGANPITWTAAAMTCTSCHGTPPGGSHPAGSTLATCGNCHGNYSNASSSIIDPAGHVNGAIDLSNMTCSSCHGTAGRTSGGIAGVTYDANLASSPPLDAAYLASSARVGTHIAHVNPTVAGGVYKPVACTECHPNNTSNAHSNTVRDVVFPVGSAARLSGYAAGFTLGNGTSQTTCATYCHGASLNATTTLGSVGATWSWNSAVAADCGSCHKSPPTTANHHNAAALTTCATCHPGTVSSAGAILVSGNLHVNGAIDTSASFTCTTCHGGTLVATGNQDTNVGVAPRGAGFPDTYGLTATTARGVGVHASHVLGTRSRPVLCNACHTVPTQNVHKTGAATTGTVALANLSLTGGIATASYSTAATTCSNTYCHGNLGGGVGAANVTPAWTAAATLACTSCHGSPPTTTSTGGNHPARSDCGTCHTGYAGTSAATWTVNAATHVDGIKQFVAQTCTSCHGAAGRASVAGADLNQASAPPADSHGATTGVLVGMHLAHVNPAASTATTPAGTQPTGGVFRPIACTECHPNNTSSSHSDGTVNLDFTLATGARLNNFAAGFTRGNGTTTATTCATWCHGAGLGTSYQGTTISPAWNGAVAACDSCHAFPPLTTAHTGPPLVASDSRACASCHAGTVNADGTINVAGGKHINGASDAVKGDTCSGCHDFGMVAATTYHHVMATDPGAAYPTSNGPAILDASRNCNICHMKHEFADKGSNLRNTVNSATPTASNTDTALCVSCHQQNNQTKDLTRQKTDGTVQTPLIDELAFGGSAHAYLVDGAFGASVMQMACVKCHNSDSTPGIQTGTYRFALHSSADRRLRAPLGRATLTDDDSAGFCYRCHSATTDATLTGTKKAATANDWYGKVTTMPAGSTGIYAQMQKGTPGSAGVPGNSAAASTLYLRNNATANAVDGPTPTAYILASGTYAGTTTFSQYDMAIASGTTGATRTNTSGTTNARYLRFGQFVSPPVAAAVTIPSGSVFQIKTRAQVSNAADTERERFQIWKRTAAGVNTALNSAVQQNATALTATATNRTFNFTTNTAVTLAPGDGLVLEIETLKGSTTSSTVTENYGNFPTDAASVVLPVSISFQTTAGTPAATASGRHDVGAYVGKHKPNPAEETLNYIAANKHVDCSDCHDPHRSKRGNLGDESTVTAAGTGCTNSITTLCNTAAAWSVDAWKGYYLDLYNVSTGAVIGNRVQITANTANQLTLASTTGTAPAAGNGYRISMRANGGAVTAATATTLTDTQSAVGGAKAWTANAFAGWYVHIVFGVGIGQSAPVLSNTATQLTINGTWTTTPTTASRYVISKMPNVMLGSSGVNVTAWGAQTPSAWGEAKTFNPAAGSTTALVDATTQWQVCFKCHSAANTALATWSASFTDLAQDFNPRNQSYHPVVAPSAASSTSGYGNTILNAADLTKGWKPGDMMTCGDCHGNDDQGTGASHGPHASAVKYILKGPNTRWPTRADGVTRWMAGTTSGTNMLTDNAGTANGLFCLNCHSSTLRSTPHTNQNAHRVACTGCHLRVPHGGKVKRLIRTTNTPAPYIDSGTGAPAAQMNSYNHSTSLQKGSCGSATSGCTTHNSLTPNTTTAPVNAW